MARAFHEDAMFTFVLPDADRRRRRLPWFFTAASRLGLAYGELHVLEQDAGAAIWLEPQNTNLGPAALMRSGLALAPVRLGPAAFRRFVSLTTAFESARAEVVDDPYWHLSSSAWRPSTRAAGWGASWWRPSWPAPTPPGSLAIWRRPRSAISGSTGAMASR